MGTNIYLQCPDLPACQCCGRSFFEPDIHLGKSSMGWTFGFAGNRDPETGPLVTTLEEWTANIKAHLAKGWTLKDEYEQPESLPDLLAHIESKRKETRNLTTYCRVHYPGHVERSWLDSHGHSFTEGEFS